MVPAQAFAGISDDVSGGRQLASMTIYILLLVNKTALGIDILPIRGCRAAVSFIQIESDSCAHGDGGK